MSPPAATPSGRFTQAGDAVLRPGLLLMGRLRLPVKLALVALVLMLPLAVLATLAFKALQAERHTTAIEIQGARVSAALLPLALALARDASVSGPAGASREASQREVAAALAAVEQQAAGARGYTLADVWPALRTRILALAQTTPGGADHRAAMAALQDLVLLNAERSELILDPEAPSYHLMDAVTNALPPLLDSSDQLLALLAQRDGNRATPGQPAAEPAPAESVEAALARAADAARAEALVLALRSQTALLGRKFAALVRAGGQVPGSWAGALSPLQGLATQAYGGPGVRAPPAIGDAVLTQLAAVSADSHRRLTEILADRLAGIERRLAVAVASSALGLLAMAYLVTVFVLGVRRSLQALTSGTVAVASGDLSLAFDLQGRDELAQIGQVMEGMTQKLSGLVGEIRNSASMVNLTGQQLSLGSQQLAARTEAQALSLRESVVSIQQLSGAMQSNARAARELDLLTQGLAEQAASSQQAMHDTVQAMQQLQNASARVAEVVAVIDDVAFQTGMLSLNAAIEASRAGAAGKGFAVVAVEVRQLAQRCAESAEEIRQLIGAASHQVDASSAMLGTLGTALSTIVGGVQQVSQQLRSIAQSSTQQSEGLDAVTRTVGNLDEITRENAALVEVASGASQQLVSRADSLREAVATMRLRTGSADEAVALVEAAVALVDSAGRDAAFDVFHQADGGFIDRDLYIFSIDRDGSYTAMGADIKRVGLSVLAVPGIEPVFVEQAWAAADAGGGWVSYKVLNLRSAAVMDKESYISRAADGTLLGCGVYRQATRARLLLAGGAGASARASSTA